MKLADVLMILVYELAGALSFALLPCTHILSARLRVRVGALAVTYVILPLAGVRIAVYVEVGTLAASLVLNPTTYITHIQRYRDMI